MIGVLGEGKNYAFLLAKSTFSSERSDGNEKLENDEQSEPVWTTWTWCTFDLSDLSPTDNLPPMWPVESKGTSMSKAQP